MATMDQLERALINADKAGDTEAAKTLAREIVRMRAAPASTNTPSPASAPAEQEGDGLALNTTAGLNSAIYTTLGAPVDLARGAINMGIRGANYALGSDLAQVPSDSFGGSESISSMFGAVGVPEPKDIRANTAAERIARGTGEGIGYAVAPQAAIGALGRAGALSGPAAEIAARLVGGTSSVGEVAANAVAGGASGAGASGAMEAAPEQLKPVAGLLGGMAGGLAGSVAATTPQMARQATLAARQAAAPLTRTGRESLAADRLRSEATDLAKVQETLADMPSELVEGSKPTTFQVTGDMGLGGLEREAQTRQPEMFNQRRADQNAARLDTLGAIQPNGAPEKVAESARRYVRSVEDLANQAFELATERARKSTEAVGQGASPEVVGQQMRSALEEGRTAAKQAERQLWSAVDPDGSLALPASSVRQQVSTTLKDLPKSAKPPQGEEAAIYGVVGQYGEVVPFSEMTALQSRIKTELRAERLANGESAAYRRLSQLNGALQTDIEQAIAGKMQQQAQAVARGEMSFEDTLAASMQREAESWKSGRQAVARDSSGGAGTGRFGAGRTSAFPSASGATGETDRGFRPASGNQGLSSGESLLPNFDRAAAERLAAAQEATRTRADTFDNKILAPIRKRPSTVAPYDMPAASIPARIFSSRPDSVEAINTLRQAVGDQTALRQIEDYAVDRLRRVALQDDGTLDAGKLESWRRSHSDALKALPALDERLKDASIASRTMGEVAKEQRLALDEARQGRLGALMNLSDPQDVTRTIGAIFQRQDRNAQMMKLRAVVSRDPEAKQGLRKAVVDHVMSRFISNTEAGTSGQSLIKADGFQNFIRENKGALKLAGLSEDEVSTLQRIADDIQRANRSISAVKLPGQSNTAQDAMAVQKGDAPATILGRILLGTAATGGFASGGLMGGAVGVLGAKTVSTLRQFGIETVNDIIADAMLNPGRARILLMTYKPRQAEQTGKMLTRTFARTALPSAAVSTMGREREAAQ